MWAEDPSSLPLTQTGHLAGCLQAGPPVDTSRWHQPHCSVRERPEVLTTNWVLLWVCHLSRKCEVCAATPCEGGILPFPLLEKSYRSPEKPSYLLRVTQLLNGRASIQIRVCGALVPQYPSSPSDLWPCSALPDSGELQRAIHLL